MYKTIRHGENSLQYTILPQNDDFRTNPIDSDNITQERRIRSKLRKTKSSILAYVGLFFVCSVVTGAIVVPLLVSRDIMPSPMGLFYKGDELGKHIKSIKSVASRPTYHPQVITLRRNNSDLILNKTTIATTTISTATNSVLNNSESTDESLKFSTLSLVTDEPDSTTIMPAVTSTQIVMDLQTVIETTKVVIETDEIDSSVEVVSTHNSNVNYENSKKLTDDSALTTGSLLTVITTLATTAITFNKTDEKMNVTGDKAKMMRILKPNTNNTTKINDSVDAKNNWFKTHLPFFEFSTYLWAVSAFDL